jgi:arylsulfatase A-like enzyme
MSTIRFTVAIKKSQGLRMVASRALLYVLALVCVPASMILAADAQRPNVVFIAIDDQNDWVGPLGGHPLAKTPNLDRLAARGTVFLNAHCQAPLCNPSRTSLMLGLRPTTTGIYGLAPWFRTLDQWKDRVTLPQHFKSHGYHTTYTGKIYHRQNAWQHFSAEFIKLGPEGTIFIKPPQKLIPRTPMGNHPLMDWGYFPHRDEHKADYQIASWAIGQFPHRSKRQPFFLAVGFSLPHVPCYATKACFDLYPDDDSVLPPVQLNDRSDTPRFSWHLHWRLPEPRLKWVNDNDQWRNLVRSYLACTSFVDAQIGRVLDALDDSGMAENTVVVVWSDHGYHLGEKAITGKNTLWERSTRVPLIFAGPGVEHGARCTQPVELLDIYPTLIDLCRLTPRDDLEGHSLAPQLGNSDTPRAWPAITSHNQGNHSVRSERWRYIRYADGSEELYDMHRDPQEWTNVQSSPTNVAVLAEHRKWLPKVDSPPAKGSASRILTYDSTTGEAVWEGNPIRREDSVPE